MESASPPQNPTILDLRVKALTHGGAFICEILTEDSELKGKPAYVREVIPGEKIRARVTKQEPWLIEAELVEVLEAAASRIKPICPNFSVCGGCDLQHIELETQRELKREMVEYTLVQKTGLRPSAGVTLIGTELPGLYYRRRVILHVHRNGEIGFFRKQSKSIIELDHCFITDEEINRQLKVLIPLVKQAPRFRGDLIVENHAGEIFIIIKYLDRYSERNALPPELATTLKQAFKNLRVYHSKQNIIFQKNFEEIDPTHKLALPAGHFFQVNEIANQALQNAVCQSVKLNNITELYAGAGNFTIPLANAGKKILAVEADRALVYYGEALVKELGLTERISFIRASVEKFIKKNSFSESLLIDPPRSGAELVMEKMRENTNTKEIVYVSCSLPTLTRDLKILCSLGFELEKVSVIDMFSQTHHVETISVLRRSN